MWGGQPNPSRWKGVWLLEIRTWSQIQQELLGASENALKGRGKVPPKESVDGIALIQAPVL